MKPGSPIELTSGFEMITTKTIEHLRKKKAQLLDQQKTNPTEIDLLFHYSKERRNEIQELAQQVAELSAVVQEQAAEIDYLNGIVMSLQ